MAVTIDGTNGITTPDLESTGPVIGTTGTFSGAVQASGVTTNLYPLVSGTVVASTSGTSIDFTSIPSWVKRVTVMFSGMSTSGTSLKQIQIGTSGGVQTTSYVNAAVYTGPSTAGTSYTSGFVIKNDTAADLLSGTIFLTLLDSSTGSWSASGSLSAGAYVLLTAGSKTLSGTLDRVRITTVNGTDTFDAGSINILWE